MAVCLWIIFDSVCNSVFKSQIWTVARNLTNNGKYDKLIIASFEKDLSKAQNTVANLPKCDGLEIELLPRSSILTALLIQSSYKEAILDLLYKNKPDIVMTRGPIATVMATKAIAMLNEPIVLNQTHATKDSTTTLSPAKSIGKKPLSKINDLPKKPRLLIQARGLLAQEFLYSARSSWMYYFCFIFYKFIGWKYSNLEAKAYGKKHLETFDYSIEAVSSSLGEYLVNNFDADASNIFLSIIDVPKPILKEKQRKNYESIRQKLGIEDKVVYAFSGSYKSWQCPAQTIKMYNKASSGEPKAMLLILTHDTAQYEALAKKLCKTKFLVLKIEDQEEYLKTLCGADFGLIFRENNIVNTVSRPVKAMDHFTCGLSMVHNNTVPWINQKIEVRERIKRNTAKKTTQEQSQV